MNPSYPINAPHEASNYDELLMQQSLKFSDSLKELKYLQKQLYSAAEYFESSYTKDNNQQELVIETFKDYATKALVSTVDHLGSVASNLNGFLEEKVEEVSATKLRFCCIEQRIQRCQTFMDMNVHSQQSLLIETPKHHKRYIISGEGAVNANEISESIHGSRFVIPRDNLHSPHNPFQASRSQPIQSLLRKGESKVSSNESSPRLNPNFTFMVTPKKEQVRRSVSPFRFSLKRYGSVSNRPNSPRTSNSSPRTPSEPRRSTFMHVNTERNKEEEMELYSRKSKNILKALLSIHKSKKEGTPPRFRDGR